MRAFTLEGNFAASQALHEMLLQSWGDRIRIFPTVPKEWEDVSFNQLRAEGGFIIDADRKVGKTAKVSITATVDQVLRLQNPFGSNTYKSNMELSESVNGDLLCQLKKGQSLILELDEK